MRETLVVCPQADNDGNSLEAVKASAVRSMLNAFGGCTVRSSAEGYWQNDEGELFAEPIWELVAATEPTEAAAQSLRQIAEAIGRAGRQYAVYVRHADGEVEIIPTAALWQSPQPIAA
jgi:nucleotide-binding universal stress UspA family protein